MATQVQICNLALGRTGSGTPISSMIEPSAEAAALNQCWDILRQQALCEAPWPFATKRMNLTQLAGVSAPSNWAYVYPYPSDALFVGAMRCLPQNPGSFPQTTPLQLQMLWEGWPWMPAPIHIPFAVESVDGIGKVLYSNIYNPELSYIKDVEDPGQFDAYFVSAFAYLLGSEIATPLANIPQMSQTLKQAYKAEVAEAIARSFSEAREQYPPASVFERARL